MASEDISINNIFIIFLNLCEKKILNACHFGMEKVDELNKVLFNFFNMIFFKIKITLKIIFKVIFI